MVFAEESKSPMWMSVAEEMESIHLCTEKSIFSGKIDTLTSLPHQTKQSRVLHEISTSFYPHPFAGK